MAKTAKIAWGIDVGNCTLKALKLGVTDEGVEALDFEVIEHDKILSQPDITPEQRLELISKALDRFLEEHDTSDANIVVSVPGQNSFARFVKLPPVETKRIPALVPLEAQQQIPFNMDDVEWDWQTFQSADSPDIELGIFAIKRDLVNRALSPFAQSGCLIDIVQMAPMALYNFLRYDQRQLQVSPQEAIITLDIGAENTDLIIVDGLKVWQRSIPIGGNQFTAAVQKAFKLSFAKAEAIKRTASTSKYARQIFQAMRSVFADLAAEIQRSLGFYSSGNRDVQFREVIALGNAMKLPGLIKFLQQSLSLPVKRLDSFDSLELTPDISVTKFAANLPSMGVAYGLALQGIGSSAITSNLLPREIIRQTAWKKKRPFFIGAAAVFFLACLLSFFNANALRGNINAAIDDISTVDRFKQTVSTNAQQYSQLEQRIQQDREEYKKIADLYSDRDVLPSVYKAVMEKLPSEKYNPESQALYEAFRQADRNAILQIEDDRHQREQVFISSIQIVYTDDLSKSFDELLTLKTKSRAYTSTTTGGGDMMGEEFGMMDGFGGEMYGGGPGGMGPGGMGPGGMGGYGGYGGMGGGYGQQPSQTTDTDEVKKEAGFAILIEGSTPHHGYDSEKPDGLGFLMPPEVGLNRENWGFFQRLLYLGQSDQAIIEKMKEDQADGTDNAAEQSGAQNAPDPASALRIKIPNNQIQKNASDYELSLPFEIYDESDNIKDYFDYTENGWVSTLRKNENQPSGLGVLKPVDTATAYAGRGMGGDAFGGYGGMASPGAGTRSVKQVRPLIDPLTFEPVSETYKTDANGQIMYGPDQKPIVEKHDYWFRLRMKIKLKSSDTPDTPAAPGNVEPGM